MLLLQEVAADPPTTNYVPAFLLLILWTGVWCWISTFLSKRLKELPAESRNMAPWTTYFLIIPVVNVFANFYVLIGISNAYMASFKAMGRELPVRESARLEGVLYSMLCTIGVFPAAASFQGIAWFVAIGAITIYLFKIHSLGERFARIQVNA